ncbi:MAG: hypothetical protein J6Q30_08005 [Oscillospiraceae bacterium]|nr:hypothetical protein [Oscillospiraceae bacterium]
MKTFNIIIKILVTLAAIAGILYVIATYGDKIAAWCKKVLRRKGGRNYEYDFDYDFEDDGMEMEDDVESVDFEA